MPELPQPIRPMVVGYPTPDEILVSVSDMADIVTYVTALHDWIRAVQACIEAEKR